MLFFNIRWIPQLAKTLHLLRGGTVSRADSGPWMGPKQLQNISPLKSSLYFCVLINMCYSLHLNFACSLTMTGFTSWRQFEFVEFKLELQMSHILSSWHCPFKGSVRPSILILLHVYLIYIYKYVMFKVMAIK